MTENQPVQADGAGALDLNKLPEMQQQPHPRTDPDGEPEEEVEPGTQPTPEEGGEHADKVLNG